ncbi:MAG: DUF3261 domain-containing protein [Treponema sp.]|nr:DUF3261 domain-containing protein [Treponema sp.]
MQGIFAVIILVSCATQPNTSRFSPVYLTNTARFALLPAADIEAPLDCAQQISLTVGGQEFSMEGWLTANENGIDISFFTSMGIGMGDFSFNDEGVKLNSPVFPSAFKAEYLAADFQLCYFQGDALRKSLEAIGLTLEITDGTDDTGKLVETRAISESGRKIIEIKKSENAIQYTNLLRGYGFTLLSAPDSGQEAE